MKMAKLKGAGSRGFTMIELLVTMTLFLIIIGAVSAIFIQSMKTQRLTLALIAVNDDASLALEQMTREIRTGFNFCPVGGADSCSPSKLVFENSAGEDIIYDLKNGALVKSVNGILKPITSGDVKISRLAFIVSGQAASDNERPFVTIAMTVGSRNPALEKAGISTSLQTSVSSRTPE